ncbi:hypothetical protein DSM112329_05121 [Paraconexibacter sp. AEG42_29]|uniref:Collagen-like protein n=1 Tax=Paraconexibacter sp. AEG42_29 TaxID=2997339 RepID=A0AAU7B2V5_9ACTN
MRLRRLITPIAAVLASFGAAAGATAALSTGTQSPRAASTSGTTTGAGTATTTAARTVTTYVTYPEASEGADGVPGKPGEPGATGPPGLPGAQGPTGQARIIASPVSINWQNNASVGRSTATFTAPGIGEGIITCRPNIDSGNMTDNGAQYIEFTPYDQDADTTMASVRTDDRYYTFINPKRPQENDPSAAAENPITVKFAHRELYTGPTFREGFNLKAFSPTYRGQGGMVGIISQRGRRGAIGGPATAKPTTFRLTWHWTFDDGNPRCYVAGAFYTEAT